MSKSYGKVKRVKSLYKRRKSTVRKAIEAAVMAALIGGLGLVGFAAGKPLLNFLFGERKEAVDDWNPPAIGMIEHLDDESVTPVNADPAEPVHENELMNAVYAPSSVLDNSTSLAAYIRQAKNNGFNAVVLEMKDSIGYLYYESGYEKAKGTEIIKGTLSAEEILAAFQDTDVKPIVRINTILDQQAPRFIEEVSYFLTDGSSRWADNRLDNGGKMWANPFLNGTKNYIPYIVGELAETGFTDIILANNLFPYFKGIDFQYLKDEYTNINTRYEALTELIRLCEEVKGDSKLIIEMNIKDVVENYNGYNNTAELLRGKKSLESTSLLLIYNKEDFGEELKTGESSSVILPTDTAGLINMLFKQARSQIGNIDVLPGFISAGLTEKEIENIIKAFTDLEFEKYMVR